MNAAEITALCTGIPAIIGAVTALVIALKAHGNSTQALASASYTAASLEADHAAAKQEKM